MRLSLTVLLLGFSTLHAKESPPNVVVILADDQGWGDLSINGNTNLKTPQIDSLARDGARFHRFFVQPVCSPTRAEFLTGRYHPRGGVSGVSVGDERLDLDERTLAQDFRTAGYSTGCFGKWHNGTQYPYHPNGRGFDEYYGFTSGHWADYFDAPLDHNGKDVRGSGYLPEELTDRVIRFMEESTEKKKPFFCYLALNIPHSPMQVPDADWKRFAQRELTMRGDEPKKEDLNHTRAALAMCENIDANVGRLLKRLKELQLEERTIVLYFSDNGPNGARWNGNMKGRKGSTDEGGVRSALHLRWTGTVPAGTMIEPIAGAIDLAPTLLSLCGIESKRDKPFDGIDLSPWLRGKGKELSQRTLFQHWAGRTSARSQQYRLDATGKLYDMIADPDQKTDISSQKPEIQKHLQTEVTKWKTEVLAEVNQSKDRPLTVGYAEFPRTVLPARDGKFSGGIKRSGSAPNCSYFTNWSKPEDRMTWSITVNTPGDYEAIIWYTCSQKETGSLLELILNDSIWKGKITEAFESPLRGMDLDRVNRGAESYMKDFQPLSLGTIPLPKGEGVLTLKASQIPGSSVADVRRVDLKLKGK